VKRTFLPMVTILALHHKYMKLFKPFTPRDIAWSVRKGFNQSIVERKSSKQDCSVWHERCRNL